MKDRWREKNGVMEFSLKLLVSCFFLLLSPSPTWRGPEEPRMQNFMARRALGIHLCSNSASFNNGSKYLHSVYSASRCSQSFTKAISSSPQPYEMDAIITILRKLRHQEAKRLAQGHVHCSQLGGGRIPVSSAWIIRLDWPSADTWGQREEVGSPGSLAI